MRLDSQTRSHQTKYITVFLLVIDSRAASELITLAGHRRGHQGRPDCHNCELQRFQVFAAQISNYLSVLTSKARKLQGK